MTRLARASGAIGGIAAIAAVVAIGTAATAARAQRVDAERARTLVVGAPPGARTDRVDGARSGLAPALPRGGLRVAWRASAGTLVDRPPLVDARGGSYVVGFRGEVVAFADDGAERWRAATDAEGPGPAALLSDDTVVFGDAGGDVIAVRDGRVKWRVRLRPAGGAPLAPLPLDDGGVVVGAAGDLAALDADGGVRARVALPEAAAGPLIFDRGRVVAVTAGGDVWTWAPGALEAVRAGAFGAAIDGGAALAGDHTLVAVASGALVAVDLLRGASSARAAPRQAAWRGPPAVLGDVACLVSSGPSGRQAVAIDAAGREVGRAWLEARSTAGAAADAGAVGAPWSPPAALLVDPSGTLAFATPEGSVGVAAGLVPAAAPGGPSSIELRVELIRGVCSAPFGARAGAGEPAVAGLAPLPKGRLLAVCRSGALLALTGEAPRTSL